MDRKTKLYKELNICRCCSDKNLVPYLDLGITPLANGLLKPENISEPELKFPLTVCYCQNCSLSQLSIVVNPDILFKNYFYMSSISNTFRNHCNNVVLNLNRSYNLEKSDLMIDIASNDGCLLSEFKKSGFKILGVEPATNLANIANSSGVPTINSFWNEDTAKKIKNEYNGAKVITAFNVFAHVDDIHKFVQDVATALNDNGIFVIQVPYLIDFLEKHEFDTVYHEHLSYFLLKPLKYVLEKNNFKIINVNKYDIHGGTIEIISAKTSSEYKITSQVEDYLTVERNLGLHTIEPYLEFAKEVQNIKKNLLSLIKDLKETNKKIAGFAASAKGNTLLNFCGLTNHDIDYIVDQTPTKQGLLTPGSHIPIIDLDHFNNNKPDYLVILAWNFIAEIISKTREFKEAGGKYIVPIPKIQIL